MTKKLSRILHLIVAGVLAVVAITLIVIATVGTVQKRKTPISHDFTIKDIALNNDRSDESVRLICHDVVINGQVRNYSDLELGQVELQIVIAGVNKYSGENMEFTYSKKIDSFNEDETYNLINEKITIMSRDGYVPEDIKEVRIAVSDGYYIAEYQKANDSNLALFAIAIGLSFMTAIVLIKWNKLRNDKSFQTMEDVTTE